MGSEDTRQIEIAERLLAEYLLRRSEGRAETDEEFLAANESYRSILETFLVEQAGIDEELRQLRGDLPPATEDGSEQRTLADFRIIREIGRGGMGIVYEAEQVSLHRLVALKVLPAHFSLNQQAVERFHREAIMAAKLQHRAIVRILAVGEDQGAHFIAMEFVRGTPLNRMIERLNAESIASRGASDVGAVVNAHAHRPKDSGKWKDEKKARGSSAWSKDYVQTIAELVLQVAEALDHAHETGIIHRDVKPSNILVRPDGRAVLTDFGLAREEGVAGITATGDFAGTVSYASPEQAMGASRVRLDHRTDLFSLGATFYELLTLKQAFPGSSPHRILAAIISKEPARPRRLNPAIPPDVETVLLKMLEKDADRRYATAREVADDLRSFLEFRPIRARRTRTSVRFLRWTRREPLKAALAALLVFGAPTVVILGSQVRAQRHELQEAFLKDELDRGFLDYAYLDHRAAHDRFAAILATDPDNEEGFAGLVLAKVALEATDEALSLLDAQAPDQDGPTQWLRVHALRASGEEERADALADELGKPKDHLSYYVAGELKLIEGDSGTEDAYEQALEYFTKAAFLAPRAMYHGGRVRAAAWREAPGMPMWVLKEQRATPEQLARSKEAALESAGLIQDRWPDSAYSFYLMGMARHLDDPSAALDLFRAAARRDPTLYPALERIGQAYVNRGEYELALDYFQQALDIRPASAFLHQQLATAYQFLERFDEAEQEYVRALAINPNYALALGNLGNVYLETQKYEIAIGELLKALAIFPDYVDARENLATAYYQLGQYERAVEEMLICLEGDPEEAAYDHYLVGHGLRKLGRDEEAIEHFRSASELDSTEPEYLVELASLSMKLGLFNEAETALETAIDISPGEQGFRDYLAIVLNKRVTECLAAGRAPGEVELAAAQRASAIGGPAVAFQYLDTLAHVRYAMGDTAGAVETQEQALARLPETATAAVRGELEQALDRFLAALDAPLEDG